MEYRKDSEIPEGFLKVCSTSELSEKKGKRFFINDVDVALFKVDNKIYAVSNVCPHQHSSVIYDGFTEDEFIVCPAHGWKFSLATGKQPEGYNGLDTYEVIVSGEDIFVKAVKKELKW
jgi:nitrite reductase/ring-hydroxylating ferredoxin subunit